MWIFYPTMVGHTHEHKPSISLRNDGRTYSGGCSLRGFKGRFIVSFPHVDHDLAYFYIISKVNITNSGLNFKNILCRLLRGWRCHAKPVFFQYLYCWLVLWCLDCRALLDFLSYGSDSAHYASKVGNFMQTQSFLISLVMTCTWCLDYRVLLDLHSYESDSWRMYTLKIVCLCAEGELGSYFSLGEG